MPKIYGNIDLLGNQIKGATLENVASFPTGAKRGRVVYHTGYNRVFTCNDDSGDTTLESAWESTSNGYEIVPFDYTDTSINIRNIVSGERLLIVQIIIDEVFNGVTPIATVGVSGNADKFMKAYENTLTEVSKYETNPNYKVPTGSELIELFVSPSGSTQGSGIVIIQVA